LKQKKLTHVYFISGMSASSKIFERIHLPAEQYKTHFLEWIMPYSRNESMTKYAKRFAEQITEENPVIVGVSFGGMLAQEIARIIHCDKIILISSLKTPKEFSLFFKMTKALKLYRFLPINTINFTERLLMKNGTKKIKRTLSIYRKYLPLRSKRYLLWATRSFLHWKAQKNTVTMLRLHGDKDKIIPINKIGKCELIENGTHVMILTKSSIIQQHLLRYLS
jgi:pimeloyl-ACP methyl ester carboxylesterase